MTGMRAFWSDHYRDIEHAGWGVELFAKTLAPAVRGKRVLDLGCGAGHLSIRLAEAGASVTGVDFVPELLALAESRATAGRTAPPRFVQQDILQLDLAERFDCICGVAILHEMGSESYPQLVDRLKRHLQPDGFCLFLENSFFNPLYRLLRKKVVGRLGLPKVGSHDETPFDQQRWDIVRSQFQHAERTCDVFVLFDRIWYQFIHNRVRHVSPRAAAACGDVCAGIDKFISARIGHTRPTLYWSWLQSIYFSDSLAREAVLGE